MNEQYFKRCIKLGIMCAMMLTTIVQTACIAPIPIFNRSSSNLYQNRTIHHDAGCLIIYKNSIPINSEDFYLMLFPRNRMTEWVEKAVEKDLEATFQNSIVIFKRDYKQYHQIFILCKKNQVLQFVRYATGHYTEEHKNGTIIFTDMIIPKYVYVVNNNGEILGVDGIISGESLIIDDDGLFDNYKNVDHEKNKFYSSCVPTLADVIQMTSGDDDFRGRL